MAKVAKVAAIAFAVVATGGVALGFGSFAVIAGASITVSQVAMASTLAAGAFSSLSAAAAAKKAAKALTTTGTQLDTQISKDAPVPFVLGRTCLGGVVIDEWAEGKDNSDANLKIALSGAPIKGIQKYIAGEYDVSWSGDPNSGMTPIATTTPASELYKHKLSQAWFNGLATDGQQLTGIANVHLQAVYDTKRFPQGMPESKWVVEGLLLYDPRRDSSYPGGSGPHRWDDPSTHEFSENPYIHGLNYALGYRVRAANGELVRVGGIGAPASQIEFAPFLAGANLADELGWKLGGVIDSASNKKAVLDAILIAGGGESIIHGASISCIFNAPKTALDTIRHDDVAATVEITNTSSWRDRVNKITPKYRAESSGWQFVTGNSVTIASYVADDGGEIRTREIEYSLVQDASQANQLAAYDLVNTREFLQFSVVCKPRLLGVRVGDCVFVELPGYGITGQKCLVVGREFDPSTYRVKLLLRSETDSKHDWALGRSDVAPTSPALGDYDPANPDAPAHLAWTAIGTTVAGPDGVVQPAIIVTGAADDVNAASVIIDYRKTGSVEWTKYAELPADTTRVEITGLEALTPYDVSVSYRTVRDVIADQKLILTGIVTGTNAIPWTGNTIVDRPAWMFESVWAPFRDQYVPAILIEYANTIAEHNQQLNDLQQNTGNAVTAGLAKQADLDELAYASINNVLSDVAEEVETKRLSYLNGVEVGTVVVNEITRTDDLVETVSFIGTKNANGTAFVFDSEKAQVANGVSLASKFTALEAATDTANAFATQQFNAIANSVTAESNAREALASQVANNAAVANQQLSTLANTTTALSQFASTLGALTPNGNAIIVNSDKLMSNATTTFAQRDSLIDAKFAGTSSSGLLTSVSAAASSANAAVNTLQQMGATLNNGSAFRLDATKIDVSGYGNLVQTVSTLQSSINGKPTYGDVSAAVSSQVSAATGPGSSIASSIQSAQTSAGNASSTATLALSSSNGNGAQAVLAVTNTANGNKLSGIRINGSTSSTIDLMAASLRVVDNSGANPTVPFAVIGGVTYMDSVVARNIGAGTVTADKIVGGAVTNLLPYEYVGPVYFGTSEMEHLTFSYFCEGGKLSLDVYCEVGTNTSSPAGAVYRLYCGSSVFNAGAVYCTPNWGQLGSTTPVVVNPGYGSHTFRVTYQATPGSGSIRANRTFVRLTELKK